ncbi:MAG: CoA-binding protein [Myxococcales bacterium]
MPHENPSDRELFELLDGTQTIAVVGASSKADKPSHGVFRRLLSAGYRVIPVNPNESEVLGQKAYPNLAAIPHKVDLVDVFRRAEETPKVAVDAARIGAKTLWLQSGIYNEEAARIAQDQGLTVVMDACLAVEVATLRIPRRTTPTT